MKEIQNRLKDINKSWEFYFWDYKFCNSKINFGTQGKINYYADIFNYLNDTLPFIYDLEYFEDFSRSVFQATGIMQTIYAHQDLIDEILHIFKLQESLQEDKNPNRKIRNELIGHPIRRKPSGRELISSIFLGNDFSNGTIHYVLYSKEDNFSGKDIYHHLSDIIERHKRFLIKYLNLIWTKISTILFQFKKVLLDLKEKTIIGIPFENLLNLVECRYETIFKSERIFEKSALVTYFNSMSIHNRYSYAISLFNKSLEESLIETIDNISDLTKADVITTSNDLILNKPIQIEVIKMPHENIIYEKRTHFNYEFSKLYDKHPIYDIDYFLEEFKEAEIVDELINMKENYNNDFEYQCSYEYLGKLLKDRQLLD